ncbi:hypothetical protein BCT30_04875 [Enterovibrio norvegicus]|nr:hypothetical protein BCU46_22185 [Enterovibrio norvegicus]PMN44349.1 hypothetical protein BCT30_04875 [Enterovibrio norvegicus]
MSRLIQFTALPVGTPQPWMSDTAPEGWAIMKGQAFDTDLFPITATLFPDGIIPDMRGRGLIGKEDGETVGAFAEGQVKSHGHDGSNVSATNLGTKYTSTSGNHAHYQGFWMENIPGTVRNGAGLYGGGQKNAGVSGGPGVSGVTNAAGNHNHAVGIGTHGHIVNIALNGALKNTIDHLKCNWIVRLA